MNVPATATGMTPVAPTTPKNQWLQALRAVAALYVLFFHCIPLFEGQRFGHFFAFLGKHGYAGVDIFMPLSGFVVTATLLKRGAAKSKLFLLERFARIFSGYWPILVFVYLFSVWGIRPLDHVRERALSTIFLLSPKLEDNWLETAWTIAYELRFYILIALLFSLLKKIRMDVKIWAAMAVVWLYNLYYFSFHQDLVVTGAVPLSYAMSGLTLEFLLGAYLATTNWHDLKPNHIIFLLIAGLSAFTVGTSAIFFANYEFARFMTFGIFGSCALVIFLWLGRTRRAPPRLLSAIGDSSYSLYLIHPLIVSIGGRVRYSHDSLGLLIPFGVIVFSVAFSHVWYWAAEKRLYQFIKNRIEARAPENKVAAAPPPARQSELMR